jgi:hypothetical protein
MTKANPRAVAERYMLIKQARKINARSKTAGRVKTAGEVRFIKDQVNALWTRTTSSIANVIKT